MMQRESLNVALLVSCLAFVVSTLVYPYVLLFARRFNIVDNPNARKLQREPVPVMGGVVVYFGILSGVLLLTFFLQLNEMLWGIVAMSVMLGIGVWDDAHGLSVRFRFIIEFLLVWIYIYATDTYIDNFHGLWGVYELSPAFGIPLSLVAGVGIINAVNLIDGVDGYSSGYGVLACACFALVFFAAWRFIWICLALIVMASLLPFFLHNVFGVKSKMFIGDGGTLMLGMLIAIFVFTTLSSNSRCSILAARGVGLVAFTLAVLCVPVFDTLRVMTARIVRGCSPFRPDKTHLHHLFIDMGFSHLGAAIAILAVNAFVVAVWFGLWKVGLSVEWQTYIVGAMGLLVTSGFYKLMRTHQHLGPKCADGTRVGSWLWRAFCRLGDRSRFEKHTGWEAMRSIMDCRFLGSVPTRQPSEKDAASASGSCSGDNTARH